MHYMRAICDATIWCAWSCLPCAMHGLGCNYLPIDIPCYDMCVLLCVYMLCTACTACPIPCDWLRSWCALCVLCAAVPIPAKGVQSWCAICVSSCCVLALYHEKRSSLGVRYVMMCVIGFEDACSLYTLVSWMCDADMLQNEVLDMCQKC